MKDSVTLPILDSGAIIIADGVILDGGTADPLDNSNSKEDGDSSLNNREHGDRVAAIIAHGDSLSNKARLDGVSLLKVDKAADGVARAGDLDSCINKSTLFIEHFDGI
jgi:predicted O-methyltransferase YrrM